METDRLLPTIEESEFENDSSIGSYTDVVLPQRRRSQSFLVVMGAVLVFMMGFLTSRLMPSYSVDMSPFPTFDMLGRDREKEKTKHKHNKHHKHTRSSSHFNTTSIEVTKDTVSSTDNETENVTTSLSQPDHDQSADEEIAECEDTRWYIQRTLKLTYELPFAALFLDPRGQRIFDASGVIKVQNEVFAVSHNSWFIAKFGPAVYAPENILLGSSIHSSEESNYTALAHEGSTLVAVRGSVQVSNESQHQAVIEELALNADKTDLETLASCPTEWQFTSDGDGIKGAVVIRDLNSTLVVLGLCGTNHCGLLRREQEEVKQTGHGILLALKKDTSTSTGSCSWTTIRTINIPNTADFPDYSDIALDDASRRVAITSQGNSQVWVGLLKGQVESGLWDVDAIEFENDSSAVYSFPKNGDCETIYCNIEGIHWLNSNTLVAVSGKMSEDQDFRCLDKDQSAHAFVLP